MINYLENSEIDREKWDYCVRNSPRPKPYGLSWYLDIMSPGWQAMTDDDYEAVFPLPLRKKYGVTYLTTPVFLQQLGAYSPDKSTKKAIDEFLEFMPGFYWLVDINVGQRTSLDNFRVTMRANYELDLSKSYDKLREKFSNHCRRNIEKASIKRPEIVSDITPGELIALFQSNKGSDIKGIKSINYQRLNSLMNFCIKNKKGRILGVRKSRRKILYGMFLIEVKGNINMLFVVNTDESREKRIGYYVVNELIREAASTKTILDFAGSSVPSIASFMESFGSANVPYYRIYRNRLPWPVRLIKK
jgi:hypothetical protein